MIFCSFPDHLEISRDKRGLWIFLTHRFRQCVMTFVKDLTLFFLVFRLNAGG